MKDFFDSLISGFDNLISGIGIFDVIDIAIIAFVIYKVLGFFRESRAEQLFKGLLVLVAATVVSDVLNLNAVNWILRSAMSVALIALVVVFQPELRRGLERLGRSKLIIPQFNDMDKEKAKEATSSIIKAVNHFSANKVGALIIMEGEISLNDFSETGVILNSRLSTELLENIFYLGAPLHDGAAIIRGDRVYAAACVLPLTRNKDLDSELGTRHRAGIGITEVSDALTIIVSEETGIISTARDGKIERPIELKALEKMLLDMYLKNIPDEKATPLSNIFRRKKDVPK